MNQRTFAALGLAEPLLRALATCNYAAPTPIQERAIPHLLGGRDLLGIAQTGTGKTAAFALPILQRLAQGGRQTEPRLPHVLVLAPTRELAAQISDSFGTYGKFLRVRQTVIFGGVGQAPQVQALHKGVDVLVATPGRLLDLVHQRHVDLRHVEVFVLDEADRMLDMGFLPDVKRVIEALPRDRQSLLFSATMPDEIARLAARMLVDPLRIEVAPQATTVEKIEQRLFHCTKADKRDLLGTVLQDAAIERALVFTRTKHGADRVAKHLKRIGVGSAAIHGDKKQGARERALEQFRDGEVRVLVATDIAARGLDVKGITHVINFDLPNIPESYVHRIGRTARAGRDGVAISFCDETEREYLRDIEKLIHRRIDVAGGSAPPAHAAAAKGHAGGHARRAPGARHAPTPRRHAGSQGRTHGPMRGPAPDPTPRPKPHPAHAPGERPEPGFGVGLEAQGQDREQQPVPSPWAREPRPESEHAPRPPHAHKPHTSGKRPADSHPGGPWEEWQGNDRKGGHGDRKSGGHAHRGKRRGSRHRDAHRRSGGRNGD
jgi:ATP-dependent RNA helicase RhlE